MTQSKVILRNHLLGHPDISPLTVDRHAGDDEFTGAALDTAGTRFSGARAWQWRNQGTASVSLSNGRLLMSLPTGGGSNYRVIEQAAPGGSYYYTAKIFADFPSTNFVDYGLVAVNNANSKMLEIVNGYNGGRGQIYVTKLTNATTSAGSSVSSVVATPARWGGYFRIRVDATTIYFYMSDFGYDNSFVPIWSELFSNHIGATPTHIGIIGFSNGPATTVTVECDWFRTSA